nr:hypothetical protein BaRGS_026902 [Batillaria attramentaria]
MNSRSRQKRETVENVVETYLSADIFNYNRFLADANNNAAQARSDLTQYYAFLEQVVNNVYETYNAAASGGQCIRVRIVGLFIADRGFELWWPVNNSLNANHDSLVGCNDNDLFVMSTFLAFPDTSSQATNPWTFSTCSVSIFNNFLASSTSACLRNTLSTESVIATPVLAGQGTDADAQCRRIRDTTNTRFCRPIYRPSNSLDFDDMCYRLYCYSSVTQCVPNLALDYTSCGDRKRTGAALRGHHNSRCPHFPHLAHISNLTYISNLAHVSNLTYISNLANISNLTHFPDLTIVTNVPYLRNLTHVSSSNRRCCVANRNLTHLSNLTDIPHFRDIPHLPNIS